MQDRVPTPGQEGRVLITPESGNPYYAKIEMADNPTQAGTPLNKSTLLKDATAALFGLPNTAVPDDVLAYLGKYAQYWWKRRINTEVQDIYTSSSYNDSSPNGNLVVAKQSSGAVTISYADNVVLHSDGSISLVNPSTIVISMDDYTSAQMLYGKYYYSPDSYSQAANLVYFCPPDATAHTSTYNAEPVVILSSVEIRRGQFVPYIGEWEYVQSSNRNMYPDSGIQGEYEYQYLGIPFENSIIPAMVEPGSYVGTGTSGSSNPNTLNFSINPQMLVIMDTAAYSVFSIMVNPWTEATKSNAGGSGMNVTVTWGETSVSWYSNADSPSPSKQMNISGNRYYYIAIGLPGGVT